ncbi:hypothetical protein ACJJTC_017455 [Scirpophaga incertulas]
MRIRSPLSLGHEPVSHDRSTRHLLGKHSSFTAAAAPADEELMQQVRGLAAQQLYEFWVSATTASGEGDATLVVGQGPGSRRPKPPKPEEHVHTNSTAIRINFYAWRDGGCPILGFRVSYRRAGTEHWIKVGDELNSASQVIGELMPATWYELSVEAYSDAGAQRATFLADTHTLTGELYEISPYATFGASAAHALQFRTLARRDLDAAPPRHRRRRTCDHYRYGRTLRRATDQCSRYCCMYQ